MSADRVIPAQQVEAHRIESFPYFTARFSHPLPDGAEGQDEPDDDVPVGAALSSPEEDARRLASIDQQIFEKLQQAERDALDTAARGYEEGFKAGEAEGRQFGESQFLAHIQRLDGHLQELSGSINLRQQAARNELLALALAVGEYLAGRAIQDAEASVAPLLEAVLAAHPFPGAATDGTPVALTVALNPKDLELLGDTLQPAPGLALRADPELSRGGLKVEAATGVLDATLEERTARLMELVHRFQEQEAL
jgi:flagellar biosynthesis/type III secretory pathway protein FliH